ncbi:DUF4280 domain-containing protein [Clostridium sp. E02]|uniref:DUF4280 domain-containing protein n=1 Tax=Clostridium sp. E02 TaxID=2487134 RepID=UPI000F5344C6|nr:DUF4280 domain-containing protein [Clostridium sp. E02]
MAELTDTYVVHGASATCSMGMRGSCTVLHKTHGVFLKNQPQMTVKDCKGDYNVICFGGCYSMENPSTQAEAAKVQKAVEEACPDTFLDHVMGFFTGGKKKKQKQEAPSEEGVAQVVGVCSPHIIAKEWDHGQEGVETDKECPLMGGAKLYCIYGGEIEIVESGQPEPGSGISAGKQENAQTNGNDFMQEQFGFDDKSSNIMKDIYEKIQKNFEDQSPIERDWYFARAISQLGDYNNKKVKVLFAKIETDAWRKGAGWAYKYDKEEDFFCNELGIKSEDYKYLRQMIRLQHFMSSDPSNYSYDVVVQLLDEDKDEFDVWKKNMEKATGKTYTDEEYLDYYKELYQKFFGKGDYSHMLYTISANLNEDKHKVDNKWRNLGANALSWKNAEERKDITGWLGDAVYAGDNKRVSFGEDDYIADLDADNLVNRMSTGISLQDSMNNYYSDLSAGDTDELRTKEFLKGNSYESIEKAVFDRISVKDANNDGIKNIEDIKDSKIYKGTYDFLMKLKSCN